MRVGSPNLMSQTAPPSQDSEASVFSLATAILTRRRLIATVVLLVLLVGLPFIWIGSDSPYTANASFIPQGSGSAQLSSIAGLAAQYGVAVPSGSTTESPQFYADLLQSRPILKSVAEASYRDPSKGSVARPRLIELFGKREKNRQLALEDAISRLSSHLRVQVSRSTGVVHFSVSAPEPELARDVADQFIAETHKYNLTTHQSHAAAERRFVEERLTLLRAELRQSEEALQGFLRFNRQFQNSPELRAEYDRLQRDLTLRQQVVGSLTQAFEQARIEEVRNTPVISVIEKPETPVRPDPRGRLRNTLLLMFLAAVIAVAATYVAALVDRARFDNAASYDEFQSSLRQIKSRVTRPFGRGGGRASSPRSQI